MILDKPNYDIFIDNGTEKSEEGVVPFKIFVWQIGRVFLELNQHKNTK